MDELQSGLRTTETLHPAEPENGDIGLLNLNISEIDDNADNEDIPIPYEYDISSYGADFPIDSLVNRLNKGDIIIPTFGEYSSDDDPIMGFQRNYVWSKPKSDRFIESFLLGLPVPGIFLVRDNSRKLLVLDGQQRLRTLQRFCSSVDTTPKYQLGSKVHARFEGKSYHDLDPPDRRRLDDSLIHATIIQQIQPTDDQSSIYDIFERLNTGGVNLQPQEIRNALYHGCLANLLLELNEDSNWRFLYGNKSRRFKDLEMILRFFAFYYNGDTYERPMKDFLNKYMSENRNLERQSKEQLKNLFGETTTFLKKYLGKKAFRPEQALNAAVLDSVMTGIAKRIQQGELTDGHKADELLNDLFRNDEYITSVKSGTAEEAKVRTRQQLALEAFARIK